MRFFFNQRLRFCLIFLILPMLDALAQERPTQISTRLRETGNWNGLYLRLRFAERFSYYAEHHWRLRNSEDNLHDFIGRRRQSYNRFGLAIQISDNLEVILGPTLVLNFSPSPGNPNFESFVYEPRFWQQWLFSMNIDRVKIYHQFRFENRWRRSNAVGSEYEFTNRYRYKFLFYVPLNKPKIDVGAIFIAPSAEIFLQSGDNVIMNPLEDFRIYTGVGYILNENVTFFGGHMWTFGQDRSGFEYSTSHIIRLNVFIGLDFRNVENKIPRINIGD